MLDQKRLQALQRFAALLGVCLQDYALFNKALTHPSFVFEKDAGSLQHNQRLEFLGDAVVDLVVGEYLFRAHPDKPEGELTRMRAALVCEGTLASAARRVCLGDVLLMGKGERGCGGADRASNLADAFEAMVGALYLELGIETIKPLIIRCIQPEIDMVLKGYYGDYKTQLQEVVQKHPENQVDYQILSETGPDHDKNFLAGVYINHALEAQGRGKTKKEAEQNAALRALVKMGELDG